MGLTGWNEIAQGGAHFPLEVAHAGTTVDVRFAEASLQSDRRVTWSWTVSEVPSSGCRLRIGYGAMIFTKT